MLVVVFITFGVEGLVTSCGGYGCFFTIKFKGLYWYSVGPTIRFFWLSFTFIDVFGLVSFA